MGKLDELCREIRSRLREYELSGVLEEGQKEAFEKALRSLEHSMRVKDNAGIKKAVVMIARTLLR